MKNCCNKAQVPNLDKNSNNGKWPPLANFWTYAGNMVQRALGLDATSSDPGNGVLHGDTTLAVMCQPHGAFQLIAGSSDGIGGIVGHGKECWK